MSANGSKFTPETRERILARVEMGVPYRDAASAAGVNPETARSWLTRGRRQGRGDYATFAADIEDARKVSGSRPAPMTKDEFAAHLDQAVRGGSVQVMKLWAELHVTDAPPADRARVLLGMNGGTR